MNSVPLPPLTAQEYGQFEALKVATEIGYYLTSHSLPHLRKPVFEHLLWHLASNPPPDGTRRSWLAALNQQHPFQRPDGRPFFERLNTADERSDPEEVSRSVLAMRMGILPVYGDLRSFVSDEEFMQAHAARMLFLAKTHGDLLTAMADITDAAELTDRRWPDELGPALIALGLPSGGLALGLGIRLSRPSQRLSALREHVGEKVFRDAFLVIENSNAVGRDYGFEYIDAAAIADLFRDLPAKERAPIFTTLLKITKMEPGTLLPFAPTPLRRRQLMDRLIDTEASIGP